MEFIEDTNENTYKIEADHAERMNVISQANCDRSSKFVHRHALHKVYQKWKGVTKMLKD